MLIRVGARNIANQIPLLHDGANCKSLTSFTLKSNYRICVAPSDILSALCIIMFRTFKWLELNEFRSPFYVWYVHLRLSFGRFGSVLCFDFIFFSLSSQQCERQLKIEVCIPIAGRRTECLVLKRKEWNKAKVKIKSHFCWHTLTNGRAFVQKASVAKLSLSFQ